MKNKQWMLRAVGVISALALGLGGLAACGNSSSAESKNGRVYYLNKKAEEQSTWVKLGKAFEKETGIPVQILRPAAPITMRRCVRSFPRRPLLRCSRLMARAS